MMFENKEAAIAAMNEAVDRSRWAESVIDDHISGEDRRPDIKEIIEIMEREDARAKEIKSFIEEMGWDEDDNNED